MLKKFTPNWMKGDKMITFQKLKDLIELFIINKTILNKSNNNDNKKTMKSILYHMEVICPRKPNVFLNLENRHTL